MANVTYSWPSREGSKVVGKPTSKLDSMAKSTGAAKYTYDVNLKNQLIVRALGCPHAHCRVKNVDASAALNVPGVVHVELLQAPKKDGNEPVEIQYQGELIAAVAAETEGAAAEGVEKLNVDYELLDVFTADEDLDAAKEAARTKPGGGKIQLEREPGDDDDEEEFENQEIERLFSESKYVVEGFYGIDSITHCCLEPHGSTVEWNGDKLNVYLSTQNVSGTANQFAEPLGITADDVTVTCEHIGGGFGSKFAADYWGVAAAKIAQQTGRPVKFMLTRDQELKIAGNRPSGYINVKLGAAADGTVQVWDSRHWGTGGSGGGGVSQNRIPYVYEPKNYRRSVTQVATNNGSARAWRAPNSPQGCAMSQTAYDDLAAKMGADSFDIFMKNLDNISIDKKDVYAEQMKIGAGLIDWKANWHPHGKGRKNGSIVEGLGMAIHTWGGNANSSTCMLRIHPDGGVESFCGTQDLGTGTRTICAMVVAETLGLPVDAVKANIGSSNFPNSGASGGSTTVGAVSESHRRAAQDALAELFAVVAPKLGVEAESLIAAEGRIQVQGQSSKSVSWKDACQFLGLRPLEKTASYRRGTPSPLSSITVGGVQMAHVAVDSDTGVVKMKKLVAVQDMGLIVNPKTAESQIYGAVIMSIAASLFEHRISDPATGKFVNAELADYKLARLGDVGEIVIHLYEPNDERQRGVVGLGEPPAISGAAAISNAVCNALGVRVPVLPLTPKRVLDAIKKARV